MGKLDQFCPGGHSIPHKTPSGECTPLRCAVDKNAKGSKNKEKLAKRHEKNRNKANSLTTFQLKRDKAVEIATKNLVAQIKRTEIELPDGADRGLANEGRVEALAGASVAVGKRAARAAFTPNMPAPDADEVAINDWADKRIVKNLPQAIAEKEYQLHFGDDEQRDKAADTFLKMNGRHEKEGKLSGGALIVIQQGPSGSGLQLPYTRNALIEGEVLAKK